MTERFELGLSATLGDIRSLCSRRLADEEFLEKIRFVNLGIAIGEHVDEDIIAMINDCGWWVALHTVDLNLSDGVDRDVLYPLRDAGNQLNARWFEQDLGIWNWGNMSLGLHHLPPIMDKDSVVRTAEIIEQCADVLGRPFIVENPPVHCAVGSLDMWDYLANISAAADCGLVLDSGHMIGYQINNDHPVHVASAEWPGWKSVKEIHISGYNIVQLRGRSLWIDRHSEPISADQREWVELALSRIDGPCAVCIEMDGAGWNVIQRGLQSVEPLLREYA